MKRLILFIALLFGLFSTSFVLADLNDGLVAYYPFNGNANDESGNGNHGTVYGATLTEDRFGNTDSAYSFDGINDYMEINNFSLSYDSITILAWVFLKSHSSCCPKIIGTRYSNYAFQLEIFSNNKIMWDCATQSQRLETDENVMELGDWYLITATYDGANSHIYYDSNRVASRTATGSIELLNAVIRIGVEVHANEDYWDGYMDDIRIYNRALSNSEIQQLYNEGKSSLTLFPFSGKIATTSGFDLTLIVQTPTLSVVGITAILDGSDVSNPVLACVREGTLPSGGETFRCPGLKAGTHLGVGTHTLNVTVDLDDGSSVSDEVTWEVLKNIE